MSERANEERPDSDGDESCDSETLVVLAAESAEKHLRCRELSALTDIELASLRALSEKLVLVMPSRRSRRSSRHRSANRVDLRVTLRRSRRTSRA